MRTLCFLFVLLRATLSLAQTAQFPLLPQPAHVQAGEGQLIIDRAFSVAIAGPADPRLQRGVERFLAQLRRQTGMLSPLNIKMTASAPASLVISTQRTSKEVLELGEDESYKLEITSTAAKLTAPTALGALHGLQTFLQLLQTTPVGFAVPACVINDAPRFPWRGLMIDVSRHFIPLDVLKRNLDAMAAVKMNVFHWHLSDDQGFRVESKKFPKLQGAGSDGLFYTQDEIRDLIAYAADRGIRVVPEFDIPGHSTSWMAGYPELGSGSGPYTIARSWHVFDVAMDPSRESTYKFLETFLTEMAHLFPDRYFHIGGDEVSGKDWDANPRIQEFKRAYNFKTNVELHAYFNQRVEKILSKRGKIVVGWEEVLQPDVPKEIVIQSWMGQVSLAKAAKQGYGGILSSGYYLDHIRPAWKHYEVDPMTGPTADLTPDEARLILGGEACMWQEYVSAETIDSRIWPRGMAVAERLWSPQSVKDVASFYTRLAKVSADLDWLGLTHNSAYSLMLRRIAGSDDVAALRTLADVVEPVKEYTRNNAPPEPPTSLVPLNRLVDAARPESLVARRFNALVDSFLHGPAKPGTEAEIRSYLTRWSSSQINLQPLVARSFLMKEVAPVAEDLSNMGTAGLEALAYLDGGVPPPADWGSRKQALIEAAKKPKAQVLLMIVPAIQQLVDAAGQLP